MAFSRSVSIASAIALPAGPQTIEDEGLELDVESNFYPLIFKRYIPANLNARLACHVHQVK
jgi:hypothetical protein